MVKEHFPPKAKIFEAAETMMKNSYTVSIGFSHGSKFSKIKPNRQTKLNQGLDLKFRLRLYLSSLNFEA